MCCATEVRRPFEKQFQGTTLHFGTCTGCSAGRAGAGSDAYEYVCVKR